ncbi:hypothetical protein Tco_0730007 [Tanacetum coccineum]|uniref:Uncharacterized protein n=1 Tax=Tanacetum coccineum TaxID=301880 RepID=A0ABQ4YRR9_9ASTR
MNMYPLQVSPPRTPGSNEYVPLVGVPSKNTGSNEYVPLAGVPSKNTRAFTCSYHFNPLKLIRNHFKSKGDDGVGGCMVAVAGKRGGDGGVVASVGWRWWSFRGDDGAMMLM